MERYVEGFFAERAKRVLRRRGGEWVGCVELLAMMNRLAHREGYDELTAGELTACVETLEAGQVEIGEQRFRWVGPIRWWHKLSWSRGDEK